MIENSERFYKLAGALLGGKLLSKEGISAEEFDSIVGSTIARMNAVGTLRGEGFEIVGGRGEMYRALSWTKPVEKVFDWTPERLEVQAWIDSQYPLKVDHAPLINLHLLNRDELSRTHECSFGYLWAYEAVGNKSPGRACAYLLIDSKTGGLAVLQRRFKNFPRIRLIDIDYPIDKYQTLIPFLSQLSTRPVEVRNLSPLNIEILEFHFLESSLRKAHQSIYSIETISKYPESFFSKKSWKSTKKNLREVFFRAVDMNDLATQKDAKFVIDTWKKKRGADQLRLAIGRDYVLIDEHIPGCWYIMGYRNSSVGYRNPQPVSLRILSEIPSVNQDTQGVADLVEKSFNYSDLPGGHSGMSDTSLVQTCEILWEKGISYINGGESSSVSKGLVGYKSKFEESQVQSVAFIPQIIS